MSAFSVSMQAMHNSMKLGRTSAIMPLGTTIAARLLFFAFLDATWWMAGYERYLVPVMPLTSCFFVLLIYKPIALCRGRSAL